MGGFGDFPVIRKKKSDVPGPGNYNVPGSFGPKSTSRHVSILGARSPRVVHDAHLGPGAYEHSGTLGGPSHTIAAPLATSGTTPRSSDVVGPKYDMSYLTMSRNPSSPRYTMGGRTALGSMLGTSPRSRSDVSPGPGSYSLDSEDKALSKFKLNSVRLAPPPPNTDESGRILGPRTQAYFNPGPGSYEAKRFGEGNILSKGVAPPRRREPLPDTPGPGAYSVENGFGVVSPRSKMIISTTFGGKGHPLVGSSCSPGPGQYNVTNDWGGKGVSISNRADTFGDLDSVNPKPGPGEYYLPSVAFPCGGKGCTISPRYDATKPGVTPGPGAYDINMGTLEQALVEKRKHNNMQSEPTTPRVTSKKENPGPGAYVIPGTFDPQKGSVIGPKPPSPLRRSEWLSDHSHTPGPGTYDFEKHAHKDESQGTLFYKGQFIAPKINDTPGPGSYTVSFNATQSSRSIAFPTTTHLT